MKRVSLLVLSIATVLACALGVSPAEAKPEGTLTVAVSTFGNERWLPHLYVGAEDVVLKPLWENLLSRDAKGNLIPMLAEKWQVADGGKTWRFQLRKGVQFHNGTELTAEDVKYTFTSLAREGSANSLAPEFRLIKSMEVEGPHAITIRFEKPFVTFGNRVTQGLFASVAYIQPKKYLESAGDQGAERHPVGTGPWKFVEHVRGDRIVFEAVENHWRATPHYKRLVFIKVPEPSTRMAMLRAGNADVIEVGGEYVDELKKVGIRTLVMPNVAAIWVILGGQWPTKPSYDPKVPWAQPDAERAKKVRHALNLAVDKKAIIERVLGGVGTPVGTVNYYPNDPWISDALLKVAYDPPKAKQLLAEAGYPTGFEVTMNLTPWPGRGFLPDVGEAVATYWEKVGIRVKRRPVDRAVFAADFRARAYAGVALAYAGPIIAPEPWELFQRISHTKSAVHLLVENPKLDAYLDRLGAEPSVAERTRIMRDEMGPWLHDFMPGIAIGATHSIAGVGPKVGEWPLIPGHMGVHNWEYVTPKR
ncbi:MAG TPA: ABC transporter substrate-binding protein [Candidatus Acidoferrum sp.]|nr:ABC transporter substrate-binding protein [Candidatus Acidoferrum sp.]